MNRLFKNVDLCSGWTIALLMFLAVMGCSGTEVGNPKSNNFNHPSGVEPLENDAELEIYLKDQFSRSVYDYNVLSGEGSEGGSDEIPDADPGGGSGEAPDSAPDSGSETPNSGEYTQTNNQEAGVDESDMVKTDGAHFYVASGGEFHVIDISGDMQVVATRSVDGFVDSLHLSGNKVIVLYNKTDGGPWVNSSPPVGADLIGFPHWIPPKMQHGIAIFDITDPQNPNNVKTVEFDGYVVSSRLIDGKLHLVQQFMPELPPIEYWYDGTQEDLENIVGRNQQAMAGMTLDQLIPHYRVNGDAPGDQVEQPTVSADNFYRPVSENGGGTIATIVSFDLEDPQLSFESIGMVMDAHIVYASTKALYMASHTYSDERSTSEETTIFKFDLTAGVAHFVGSGIVPGWILNQFSLGEYQDVLRVATTTGHAGGWGPTAKNHVFCLALEKDKLKAVGSIRDIAPEEQIYAARFMNERGYLVTFVRIDPLFTLNLSDPTTPTVAGELKVPGYSDYIHPYGDDYLITVGRDVQLTEEDNAVWIKGVQVSIFDVSDFSNPVLLHNETIGTSGTYSEALYNHKAFTFWSGNDMLALPINLYEHQSSQPENPWDYGTKTFEGLFVYHVSASHGFDLLGRINTERNDGNIYSSSPWTRGLFVDQRVYAVTDNAVYAAETDQIEESVHTLHIK